MEVMCTHVLWSPSFGKCDQCGKTSDKTRMFSSGGKHFSFCKFCLYDYLVEECNAGQGPWAEILSNDWSKNVSFNLEFDEEPHGTTQEAKLWN